MIGMTQVVEVASSAAHIVSLSVAVTHLAEHQFYDALLTIAVGCFSFAVLTTAYVGCELVRWKVRQYIRKRELPEMKPESPRLEG